MLYTEMDTTALEDIKKELELEYEKVRGLNLKLNMSRGKPAPDQVAVSFPVLDELTSNSDIKSEDGTDCSNYGVVDGIPEAKKLMADMMGVSADNTIVCGNSSLNLMYDQVSRGFTHGYLGSEPWCKLDKVKFLCPVPGYDRHFLVTQHFGVEMINIPMTSEGPDMDMIEELVANDPCIKGMWVVPRFSNPTGITYSNDTLKRLAALKPAAKDFRIFYDNAYCVHSLYGEENDTQLIDIFSEAAKHGNEDMIFEFSSTSKITFPGAGISAIAASDANIKEIKKTLTVQTIGHDKLNQLRHVRFFKDIDGIKTHMKKHADFIRPKFEKVLSILERELGTLGVGEWTNPRGGYFISFDSKQHCADKIYELCKDAGVTLTGAGATYPYGKDPENKNLRIAPTFPTLDELEKATELFALAVKLASVRAILGETA